MKHWRVNDVAWQDFDPARVDPGIVPLVKAASMVEKNGTDYAIYLNRVFHDDPDFQQAADNWATEEVQHGDALGRWAELADPGWSFDAAFARYRAGYKLPLDAEASVRGSRTGELIARCMVETGTSSYYTALGEATEEPVLKQVCKLIAADEYRHFKLFYDHMKRYLGRERIGLVQRLRIAAGRITESEDDELAYAYHCGNEPEFARLQARALHRGLHGPGDGLLSLPAHRARHGHGPEERGPAAPRSPLGRGRPARLGADAAAAAQVRPGAPGTSPSQRGGAGRGSLR